MLLAWVAKTREMVLGPEFVEAVERGDVDWVADWLQSLDSPEDINDVNAEGKTVLSRELASYRTGRFGGTTASTTLSRLVMGGTTASRSKSCGSRTTTRPGSPQRAMCRTSRHARS